MIHAESLKKHIRFAIEHYGTRTQGEDHRLDQVTDHLVQLILELQDYQAAINEVAKNYPEKTIQFSIAIG